MDRSVRTLQGIYVLAIHLLFVLSGFCGLAYEVIWLREVGLLLGSDGVAVAIVAATFMGGMGIGYVGAGRLADRMMKPILVFGCIEAGIGLLALLLLLQFRMAPGVLAALYGALPGTLSHLPLTMIVSAFILLPPTILMGATLPVLCVPVESNTGSLGYTVGTLYGANLAGATCGTLLAGIWMLDRFGTTRSIVLVAILSISTGALATLLSILSRHQPSRTSERSRPRSPRQLAAGLSKMVTRGTIASVFGEKSPSRFSSTPNLFPTAAMSAFAVGLLSMAFQIIWIRGITPFVGSTIYAFSGTSSDTDSPRLTQFVDPFIRLRSGQDFYTIELLTLVDKFGTILASLRLFVAF